MIGFRSGENGWNCREKETRDEVLQASVEEMSCDLLTIGTSLPGLADRLRMRAAERLDEGLASLAELPVRMAVAAAEREDFAAMIGAAAAHPSVSFVLLTEETSRAELAPTNLVPNLTVLPKLMGEAQLEVFVLKLLSEQEQKRESRELLEGTVAGTVAILFEALSITDPYSASLGQRLRYAADLFCKTARIELAWEVETAALLADIGVLTVPSRVITKSQSGQELSGYEKELISHIPERGADLLQQVPSFHAVSRILRYQQKNFDGTGLPSDGLSGDRIPLGARILKVLSDLFRLKDAGKTQEEAISEMRTGLRRYDPLLLEAASQCFHVNVPANINGNTQGVSVRDLRPGQLLVSNILTEDGVLLIRDGQVISARLLHKLRNFAFTSGIKEPIYVIDLLKSREMTTTFQDIAHSETAFLARAK